VVLHCSGPAKQVYCLLDGRLVLVARQNQLGLAHAGGGPVDSWHRKRLVVKPLCLVKTTGLERIGFADRDAILEQLRPLDESGGVSPLPQFLHLGHCGTMASLELGICRVLSLNCGGQQKSEECDGADEKRLRSGHQRPQKHVALPPTNSSMSGRSERMLRTNNAFSLFVARPARSRAIRGSTQAM
jgi:hypothetical protein